MMRDVAQLAEHQTPFFKLCSIFEPAKNGYRLLTGWLWVRVPPSLLSLGRQGKVIDQVETLVQLFRPAKNFASRSCLVNGELEILY